MLRTTVGDLVIAARLEDESAPATPEPLEHQVEPLLVRCARVDAQRHAARDDVRGARLDFEPPHRRDGFGDAGRRVANA
jgi:hypothetical protein